MRTHLGGVRFGVGLPRTCCCVQSNCYRRNKVGKGAARSHGQRLAASGVKGQELWLLDKVRLVK